MSAILFLYRHVLKIEPDETVINAVRPQKPKHVPTVLSKQEAKKVIENMQGIYRLMAQLMYGSGLRLMEVLRLRVKDLDFANHQIIVRDGKGENDRITMFPDTLLEPLRLHLNQVKALHEKDLFEGYGTVYLPYALEKKYPDANREWAWQYVFPAADFSKDPVTGIRQRHHIHETSLPSRPSAKSSAPGRPTCQNRQTRFPPHLPSLIRHPPPAKRLRYPNCAGIARPQGCQNHHDLHPRPPARCKSRQKPPRSIILDPQS